MPHRWISKGEEAGWGAHTPITFYLSRHQLKDESSKDTAALHPMNFFSFVLSTIPPPPFGENLTAQSLLPPYLSFPVFLSSFSSPSFLWYVQSKGCTWKVAVRLPACTSPKQTSTLLLHLKVRSEAASLPPLSSGCLVSHSHDYFVRWKHALLAYFLRSREKPFQGDFRLGIHAPTVSSGYQTNGCRAHESAVGVHFNPHSINVLGKLTRTTLTKEFDYSRVNPEVDSLHCCPI